MKINVINLNLQQVFLRNFNFNIFYKIAYIGFRLSKNCFKPTIILYIYT